MIARVVRVDEYGWWVLRPIDRKYAEVTLPTFALPKNTRYTDDVHLVGGGEYSMIRVAKIVRRLRTHYGRPKQYRR